MSKDAIGQHGEYLFATLMTNFCGNKQPYFGTTFLGDKYPTVDFYVHVVGHPSYFFVQVKTTTRGYTSKDHLLKVQVSQKDVDLMVDIPAPTYVVGMDMKLEVGFLLSVNEPRRHLSSLTTKFQIVPSVLKDLRDEVVSFWSTRNQHFVGSKFK